MKTPLRIAPALRMLAAGLLLAGPAATQKTPGPEPGVTFRTRVDLVMVPVVVRDSKGRAVATLTKENFQLFDNGKARPILQFAVERSASVHRGSGTATTGAPGGPVAPGAVAAPDHFAAYLFDDLHASVADMAVARLAALQHLRGLAPATRAAIYATSGRNALDFTAEQALLEKAVAGLRATLSPASASIDCPSISYYEAHMITDWKRRDVLETLVGETSSCLHVGDEKVLRALVESRSRQVLEEGQYQVRLSLIRLRDAIRRLSAMPGKRVLVLVSPGFLSAAVETEINSLIDGALRAGIVINTLDVRGLYTEVPGGDASRQARGSVLVIQRKADYEHQANSLQSEVLGQLARATGGRFFHNRNDLEEGLNQLAAPPEAYYVLGFTPSDAKDNGRLHTLRVRLTGGGKGLSVQARPGYFARKPRAATGSQAKEELSEELLSRQELDDLPVTLETGLELLNLAVIARIDYARLEALSGRKPGQLAVVSAVFDGNGKLVKAIQKTVDLSLAEPVKEKLRQAGLVVRTDFRLDPGPYTVRVLVRTPEGELLAAHTLPVAMP